MNREEGARWGKRFSCGCVLSTDAPAHAGETCPDHPSSSITECGYIVRASLQSPSVGASDVGTLARLRQYLADTEHTPDSAPLTFNGPLTMGDLRTLAALGAQPATPEPRGDHAMFDVCMTLGDPKASPEQLRMALRLAIQHGFRMESRAASAEAALQAPGQPATPEPRWGPIESAPRDGTMILGYWPGESNKWPFGPARVRRDGNWEDDMGIVGAPVAWTPLPAPPGQPATRLEGDEG